MSLGQSIGRPVGGYDPSAIMDAADEESRLRLMQQMGVANLLPPLPHSPCLKVIKTGVIHPWNELLAAQRDLVVCCDEDGNTDPSAWESKVVTDEVTNQELALKAQSRIFGANTSNSFQQKMSPVKQQNTTTDTEYDKLGVTAFNEIQKLRERLHQ